MMAWAGGALSVVYSGVVQLRNAMFDQGVMKPEEFEVPIVSVGNITAGGTGKTPLIQELIRWGNSNGIQTGVVSRGYGGTYSDVQEVLLDSVDAPRLFGDEPVLTKTQFPNVPFFVCRERARAVKSLLKSHSIQLVLADDAFQHRKLSRDLDIVILDALQDEAHYQLLPKGRLREPLSGLGRAHFIIVTRWNLASDSQQQRMSRIIDIYSSAQLKAVVHCDYEILNAQDFSHSEEVILFSGIGNPKAFEIMMNELTNVHSHVVFNDHHNYISQDIKNLLQQGKTLVTTEKDAIKLQRLKLDIGNIKIASLGLRFDSNMEKLFGAIHQLSS